MVLDVYDDNGLYLRSVFPNNSEPSIIKMAANASFSHMSARDYAYTGEGLFGKVYKYPIMDAGNALISAVYFEKFAAASLAPDEYNHTRNVLAAALHSFGFSAEALTSRTHIKEASMSKTANDLELLSIFGMTPGEDIEIIEDAFAGMTPRGKQRLAGRIKTAHPNASFTSDYEGTNIGPLFEANVIARMQLVDEPGREWLTGIMKMASDGAPAEAVIDRLETFDITAGIDHLYGELIANPVKSVLEGSSNVKVASLEMDGFSIPIDDLADMVKAKSERIISSFGEPTYIQLAGDPDTVLRSLPTPERRALLGIISG